jgi:hypothetical protein
MTVSLVTDGAQTGWMKIKILGEATAAHCLGAVQNPEGVLLQITRGILYIETAAGAASTLHVGPGVSATGDYHDMVDGFDLSSAAGTVWQIVGQDLASEGAATAPKGSLWTADYYLTFTTAAQVSTSLVAYLFLQYVRLS